MKKRILTALLVLAAGAAVLAGCGTETPSRPAASQVALGGSSAAAWSTPAVSAQGFAEKVQAAVAAKDLSALADLCSYPVYVGVGEGEIIRSRKGFLQLDVSAIFPEDLVNAIAAVDVSALQPVQAGYVMSGESGTPNIIFQQRGDSFGITGINYAS